MKRALAAVVVLGGCGVEEVPSTELVEQAATVCADGPTLKGIDVSHWQGTIDWARVKADGVEYAFSRVSDGTGTLDREFARNWAQSRQVGILRGAYQFFRPNQDSIAQAELFLDTMGPLADGDLPPVIDVEADGGLGPSAVAAAVGVWIDHVRAATGREPIIYTGYYFWRDKVGGADYTTSPLWHAQYTSAECPNIPAPWTDWAFWQFTSTGSVDGISGNVDVNRFNGTRAQLEALTTGTTAPCGVIAATGGLIDDGDACFRAGGTPTSLRRIATAGEGGDLIWTHTTDAATEDNFAEWSLHFAEGGRYRLEVMTSAAFAESTQARYVVTASGATQEVVLDQTAVDGWQSLGEFTFAAGGGQQVHLGDNTGEPGATMTQVVFDGLRLTRLDAPDPGDPGDPGDPNGSDDSSGGCSAAGAGGASTGGAGGLAVLAAAGLRRRRRR